jgi:DNA replication and repair protein RecF
LYIDSLRIENFRNLKQVEIRPHPRLNYFFGANGAGKTSLLEALVVLSRGKSFKTGRAEELSGEEDGTFRIVLECVSSGRRHKLGLERRGAHWKARKNGQDLSVLSALTRQLPMVLMEPNSHLLISGPPENRRRFLDWGVFHVEPAFLDSWRRYSRVLKQRNAALRERQTRVLGSLDELAADLGERLHGYRAAYFGQLADAFSRHTSEGAAEFRDVVLEYRRGWKDGSLLEALRRSGKRDLEQGSTSQGPHRADILVTKDHRSVRSLLSRGEQKSFAAALLMTQAGLLASGGEAPLLLLDDLASEFDQQHVQSVLENALACAGQVWVTGTAACAFEQEHKLFHVEHGAVRENEPLVRAVKRDS